MARPTKLTPELLAKLEDIADAGMSIKGVCAKLNVGETTWRTWEASTEETTLVSEFRGLAARVRARANAGMLDKCDGVIAAALDDPDVRPGEKAALAIQYKRLVGTHKVEVSGGVDIVTLARLAESDAT